MGFFSFRDGALFVHHTLDEHPSSGDFSMHAHECYELFYYDKGSAVFWVEGTPYPLLPGDMMLFNVSEAHKIELQSDAPYERTAVHFSGELAQAVDPSGALLHPFCSRPLGKGNLLHPDDFKDDYWRQCLKNIVADAADRRLQIVTNLLPLLNEIRAAFDNHQHRLTPNPDYISSQILEYVNANICEALTPDGVAARFFISKSRLYTIFKQATGLTVWNYITVKRLLRARQLLAAGQTPTAVATACGFRDYTVFFRAYKKKYGVSPRRDYCKRP